MATKTKTKAASPPKEYTNAMDKIRDEMARTKSRYVQVIGEFLTDYLLKHPEAEAAILAEGKTINGSLRDLENYARQHKEGSVAVVDDRTAFGVVLEYFGIKGKAAAAGASSVTAGAVPPSQTGQGLGDPQTPADTTTVSTLTPDPFDLDALMGGM